jgi:pimeloyl-ACP methyl ester carboxylesterase
MTVNFDVMWLNVSPSLKRLDQPLVKLLGLHCKVAYWQYIQTMDEGSCLEKAVQLLHECLEETDRPIHLIGHGMAGVVGLIYARRYPGRVRSLTILSVAPQPGMTWHTHYYAQRNMIPCGRKRVLAQMVHSLFGTSLPGSVHALVHALERDLEDSPSPHSLYKLASLPKLTVEAPMLVCGSVTDAIVTPPMLHDWVDYFKPGDKLWKCPTGHHFFHFFHPNLVAEQLLKFWQQTEQRELKREFAEIALTKRL